MGYRSRWALGTSTAGCSVPKSAYSLEVSSGTMTWRNGVGSLDIEAIVSTSENEVHSSTRTSGTQAYGQTWAYYRSGDRIRVQPGGKAGFMLTRCP
jgi:hypothetical protein